MIKIGVSVLGVIAAGAIALVLTGGVPQSRGTTGSVSKIEAVGIPESGIAIVGPADSNFNSLISETLKRESALDINALKSSSVYVVNNSGQSLAALRVRWELLQPDGRSIVRNRDFRGRLQVVSDGGSPHFAEAVVVNEHRLVSWVNIHSIPNSGIGFNMGAGRSIDPVRELLECVKATVSVDAVLFSDGTFVGPDSRDFFGSLSAEIEATREVFEEIARAFSGDAEAMKRVEILAKNGQERVRVLPTQEPSTDNQMVKQRFAAITMAMRKELGDNEILKRINDELSRPRISLRKL